MKYLLLLAIWGLGVESGLCDGLQDAVRELGPDVGGVIDAEENARYNILGDIPGLSAAGFVRVDENRYRLYVVRNSDKGGQIYLYSLNKNAFLDLRRKFRRRAGQYAGDVKSPLFHNSNTFLQETAVNKQLFLRDGNVLLGQLTHARLDTVFIKTMGGLHIAVPAYLVSELRNREPFAANKKFFRTDPNTSRLFFAPTGRKLEKATGYFADYYIFFPTVAFGFTDHISMSAGMSIVPGLQSQLFYLAPKLTFEIEKNIGLGTGILVLFVPDDEPVDLGYAVTTFGSERNAVTVGVGLPLFSRADIKPIVMLGAETQISNRVKLLTENWLSTGRIEDSLISAGIRFFGDRMATDLALLTFEGLFTSGGFPFVPYVGFSVCF